MVVVAHFNLIRWIFSVYFNSDAHHLHDYLLKMETFPLLKKFEIRLNKLVTVSFTLNAIAKRKTQKRKLQITTTSTNTANIKWKCFIIQFLANFFNNIHTHIHTYARVSSVKSQDLKQLRSFNVISIRFVKTENENENGFVCVRGFVWLQMNSRPINII